MKTTYFFLLIAGLTLSLCGSSYAQSTAAVADSIRLSEYTGTYTFTSGSPIEKFTVTAQKGELMGEANEFGKNRLVKQAKEDTYQSTSSYGSVITFIRDVATKAVTGLTLAAQGTELTAKKENP